MRVWCVCVGRGETITFKQFEFMKCTMTLANKNIDIFVFYRPPASTSNQLSTTAFIDEWCDFIAQHSISKSELIIVGDVNLHLDDAKNHKTLRFLQTLESHSLQQHIHAPTHYQGHTLDTLITRDDSTLLSEIEVVDIGLCNDQGVVLRDHYAISCKIQLEIISPKYQRVSFRNFRNIDVNIFRQSIKNSPSLNNTYGTLDELTDRYITDLTSLLDVHAPLQQRLVLLRPHSPWYNENLRNAKRVRRKLERVWRTHGREPDRLAYRHQCGIVAQLLTSAKTNYYTTKVEECRGDQKALSRLTNNLLKKQMTQLPSAESDNVLANTFGNFFSDKISNIRSSINNTHPDQTLLPLTNIKFSELRLTNSAEIRNVIKSCNNSSCQLDPIPTWLLKCCIEELLPLLEAIFNNSLSNGTFPSEFKSALIRPLLKRPNLGTDELKNYRPVSNLHFVAKVLEKLVMIRLDEHMETHSLHDPMQSAYKKAHSTETALVRISNDILQATDNNKCVILASLDLSAAFDTVDHSTFVYRLKNLYGVSDISLRWFTSYLTNRSYKVCVNGSLSTSHSLISGVPQGSVLGARFYTMYTYPMSKIVKDHNLCYHSYADDTQIYVQCENNATDINTAISRLKDCIGDICLWMSNSSLKINEQKTELIIFHSSRSPVSVNTPLVVGTDTIMASSTVKILGVTLDATMTLDKHITNTVRSVNMQLRKISTIRRYLSDSAVKTLVQSTVISRLDYCNSLYAGLPKKQINRLQLSHNNAARLISLTPRCDHITPVLNELHWLPVYKRCQFKVLVIAFNALHDQAPGYIQELLDWYHPSRPLRSASTTSLTPRRHRTVSYGRRLLDTAASVIWNSLPNDLKCATNLMIFKNHVKTFLFAL